MIDTNQLRAEFAKYLHEHTHTRWGVDAALMHVCRMAYEQGQEDASTPPLLAPTFCVAVEEKT
jgi:hypothetical protein